MNKARWGATDDGIEWRDIPSYEGLYQVSNDGQVRNSRGKLIRPFVTKQGYRRIELSKANTPKKYNVHRLVMLAFVGGSELQVNHMNGIRHDNRLENLEYVTNRENMMHAIEVLKSHHLVYGEKHVRAKLTQNDVHAIRRLHYEGVKNSTIARQFGVDVGTIVPILKGRTWKQVPHKVPDGVYQAMLQNSHVEEFDVD